MKISEGSELPRFNLLTKVNDEILEIKYEDLFVGKTVALFGMPGAFTPTCSGQHLPSIIESEKDLNCDYHCISQGLIDNIWLNPGKNNFDDISKLNIQLIKSYSYFHLTIFPRTTSPPISFLI